MSENGKKLPDSPMAADLLARRRLFKAMLLGTAGIGSYAWLKRFGLGGVGQALAPALEAMDSVALWDPATVINDALRFGPSLFRLSQAMAQSAPANPAVFRVFYGTSHDIRNELCLTEFGGQYNPLATLNFAGRQGELGGLARKSAGPHPFVNEWAYALLTTGKINGQAKLHPNAPDKPALSDAEKAQMTVIAAVGMNGSEGIHRRAAVPKVGTLEYAIAKNYAGYSPIGVVSFGSPVIDAAGGVNEPGKTVNQFLGAIDVPAVYMSRADADNPVFTLDALAGKEATAVRKQMLDAHRLLIQQLGEIRGKAALANMTFGNYGQRDLEGLTGMVIFAELFEKGLANVGSSMLNSFDFHATDALRAPAGPVGNMLTETSQALAGAFYIARSAFNAKRDAIIHFTTCSNRNETWVNDDSHVSTFTVIVKGAGGQSPFASLPPMLTLFPGNMNGIYAEGPGNNMPNYAGPGPDALGLTGVVSVGRLEAGLVKSVGAAIKAKPTEPLEEPAKSFI